jgi:hypothetical protein
MLARRSSAGVACKSSWPSGQVVNGSLPPPSPVGLVVTTMTTTAPLVDLVATMMRMRTRTTAHAAAVGRKTTSMRTIPMTGQVVVVPGSR